jgi:hypothetical protein
MFTQGTVTVTATSPGLGQGTTSFTVYPLDAITIAQGQSHPIVETALRQTLKTAAVGSTLRYFISSPANVAVDILDASGRMLNHVPVSKQMNGWHPLPLGGPEINVDRNGTGVYFVRFAVDGQYLSVKRMVLVR